MEKLRDLLKSIPIEERDAFAGRCDTSFRHLTNIAGGYRKCGEKLAVDLERETGGAIRCEDLRPDVDWAVLRNSSARVA